MEACHRESPAREDGNPLGDVRSLADALTDGLLIAGADGAVLHVNGPAASALRRSVGDLLRRDLAAILDDAASTGDSLDCSFSSLTLGGSTFTLAVIRPQPAPSPAAARPDGNAIPGEFERLFEHAPTGITTLGEDGRLLQVNRALAQMLGYARGELHGATLAHITQSDDQHARGLFERLAAGELDAYGVDRRYVRKDGSTVWVQVNVTATAPAGTPGRMLIAHVHEIGAQKSAEARLHRVNERYDLASVSIEGATYDFDIAAGEITWSDGITRVFGYPAGTQTLRDWREYVHPHDRSLVRAALPVAGDGDDRFAIEYRLRRADGTFADVWERGQVFRDETGHTYRAIGSLIDVTGDRTAERSLRIANDRYQVAASALNGAVYDQDLLAGMVQWSDGIQQVFGYPSASAPVGDWLSNKVHPDDREKVRAELRRCEAGKAEFEVDYRFRRADGTYADVRDRAMLVRDDHGKIVRSVGVVSDVTEKRQAGDAIADLSTRIRSMAETFNGAIYSLDLERNDALHMGGLIGDLRYSAIDGGVSSWWNEAVHPDDRERAIAALNDALSGTAEAVSVEYRFLAPDGQWIHVWDRSRIVRDAGGRAIRIVGTLFDITAHKQAQELTRGAEVRYQALVEQIPAYVAAADGQATLLYMSPKCAEILGLDEVEAIVPDAWLRMLHDEDRGRMLAEIDVATQTGEPLSTQHRMVRKDGEEIWVQAQAVVIRDEDRNPAFLQGVMFDITQQKRQETALFEANDQLQEWVQQLEQRGHEIALLSEVGELLQACLSEEEAYAVFAPFARKLFPYWSGSLSITNASRNVVETAAAWGTNADQDYFTPDDCWALRRGRTHVIEDPTAAMLCRHLSAEPPASYVCVPMMAKGEALGVLHLASDEPGTFSNPDRERLVAAVAEHIALSLANLKLRETLRLQSIRDPLTGLFNRRYMEESLIREVSRCNRHRKPLSVLMLDIDHFKQFNDSFGHEAGDTLLKALGESLRANTRTEDIACRYGGEELTLILPDAGPEDAMRRADQLREAIKQLDVRSRGSTLGAVTVSIGIASNPIHATDAAGLLYLADQALYLAKHQGRDRAVMATRPDETELASA